MSVSEDSRFDVIIIGAGPAGTTCASMLARRGVRVFLCDKAIFPREKICGDCINPGCWDLFRLLGVQDEVLENAEPITGIRIAGRSARVLEIPFKSAALSMLRSPFVALKRSKLDSILLHRAIEDGAAFLPATSIDSCCVNPSEKNSWTVQLRSRETGGTIETSSRFLIGADGRNSRVAALLGGRGGERGRWKESNADRVGVQFTVRREFTGSSDVVMYLFEGGYGGIVGVSAGESNVAMVVTQRLARLAVTDFERFVLRTIHANRFMRINFLRLDLAGEIHTTFPISPARRSRHSSPAYLIGDAHIRQSHSPERVFFLLCRTAFVRRARSWNPSALNVI